jgi:RND family efflux transporter MFP subunit
MTVSVLFRAALAAAFLILSPAPALAHGGEDHGAPPAPSSVLSSAPAQTGFAAEGDAFQVVMLPGEDGSTRLFLADLETNAPVAGATIDAEAAGWQGQAHPESPGLYHLAWTPPADGADVTLMIGAQGRDDLVLVRGVAPLPPLPAAAPPVEHWRHYAAGGLIGAGLGLAGLLLSRRRAAAVILALLPLSGNALAHDGHDHGAAPPPSPPGTQLALPKATQFLLGIRTLRVEPREAADTVRVVGRVVPDPAGYARVQPSQPARVIFDPNFPLPVPGQWVRRGQVIAVLEPTLTSLERSDKRATLYRVESDIAIQEREAARQVALGGIVAPKTVEDTRTRLDQLRREKQQLLGTALGRDLVTAPLDGIVADVHIVPGEVVTVDRPMIEIVDPTRLRVEAVIHDFALAGRIAGATASSRPMAERPVPLTLLGVSPRVDAQDQGIHALFAVAGEEAGRLRIGMPVDVFVATGASSLRIAVPREAVAEHGGRQVVFVRTAPESFEARPVRVERTVGALAEIDGLRAGERVVVQGVEQLKAVR